MNYIIMPELRVSDVLGPFQYGDMILPVTTGNSGVVMVIRPPYINNDIPTLRLFYLHNGLAYM